jgi:heme/copper-type cytochrome/quinol oxidase subunit 3
MNMEKEPGKLLMWLLIGSESFFFGSLITSYIYLAFASPHWQSDSQYLDLIKTGIFSLFLFASSGTLILSEHFGEKKKHVWQLLLLGLTIVAGIVFLFGQGIEYASLFRMNLDPSKTVFTSVFFTLTGFHAFHVIVGLICLIIVFIILYNPQRREKFGVSLRYIGLYWHFVDIVWIAVFGVVYILPRLI